MMQILFDKTNKLLKTKLSLVSVVLFLFCCNNVFAQLPPAQEVVGNMKVGWNMGNTLEAICGETDWGGAHTTQKLIDSVKAAGFNSIRIPCAWFCHSDTATNIIDADWLERVQGVIDYCMNDSLYTILNIHWDNGWLENNITAQAKDRVNQRQKAYWTQIANTFKDYDEHLLFAGSNEPNVETEQQMDILMTYHQSFIDAVRGTGGNNSSRTLIVQGPYTDIQKTNDWMNSMPVDSIEDRLVIEIHYYTPYQFTLMTEDASWGKMFYYWGKDYHSNTDPDRNPNWGEESDVEKYFGWMKTKFVDKGIPVILGEYGAYRKKLSPPHDDELNSASVVYYNGYVSKSAVEHGMVPFYWDTNWGLFNRDKGEVIDHEVLKAIMDGVEAGYITGIEDNKEPQLFNRFQLRQNYPNPFNPTTNIEYQVPVNTFVKLVVFDSLGREVETLVNRYQDKGNYTVQFNAVNLPSGVYFYTLEAGRYRATKKLILIK